MKTIVCGGRGYNDPGHVFRVLTELDPAPSMIIEGGASGADAWAKSWGMQNDVPLSTYYADWAKHGRAAGPIRNAEMLKVAERVVAFPGGKGTADMVRRAKVAGIPVIQLDPLSPKEQV